MQQKYQQLKLTELALPLTWLIVANAVVEIVFTIIIFGTFNPILIALDILGVACAFALHIRNRWAFYGFLGTSFLNIFLGRAVFQAALGLAGVLALYAILHKLARENWPQLE
jgi:hypothetical protein